jgi:hypothetical protein
MQPQEALKITGTVIIRSHEGGTIHLYESLMKLGRKEYARRLIQDGKIEVVQKNLVVDSPNYGIDILIQYLISGYNGSTNFPLGIAWGEIGTGQTTPSAGDTALTTPTNRAAVAWAGDYGLNTAQLQFFFPDSILANQTYYECGSFIGGTSTIGSGNLFNHALFSSGYSKSSGTDTTLEIDISISN